MIQVTLCSTDGTSYNFTGSFASIPQPQPGVQLEVTIVGNAVCATDNSAIILDAESCRQGGSGFPQLPFCAYGIRHYTGKFRYGVSSEGRGVIILQGLGDTVYPFDLECIDGMDCQMAVTCNTSTAHISNVYVQGGEITNVSNSNIILQENNTAVFEGSQVTIVQSNFTIQQGDAVNTTNIYTQETTVNIEVHESAQYNIYTSEPVPCGAWFDWSGVRTANVTLSTASWTELVFTASSDIEQGEQEDWEIINTSELRYTGDTDEDMAYAVIVCAESGLLFDVSPEGQRVQLAVFNVTGTPEVLTANAITSSTVLYNHTDPAFFGGMCAATVIKAIYQGNTFALGAKLVYTDGNSGSAILGAIKASLAFLPVGCSDIETSIEIEAEFNNTQLVDGNCTVVRTVDEEHIAIDNTGVCSIVVEIGPVNEDAHAGESWLRHTWHKLRDYIVGAAYPLAGTIYFTDTRNIEPRFYGENQVYWDFKCPIECGEEPINTNSTCNCEEGVNTEGTCDCGSGVETPGTCSCGEKVETPEIETPNGEELEIPDGINTPNVTTEKIETPGGEEPLKVPSGIETPEISGTDGEPIELPDGIVVDLIESGDGSPITMPSGIETPSVDGPGGMPVAFPTGIAPGPPMPITIVLNPASGGSGGIGGGGKGPCESGGLLLDPNEPVIGFTPDGRKVKLIGSIVSSAVSAATSGVSAATSAATGAAGAVASFVAAITGCNLGGPPLPSLPAGLGTGAVPSGVPGTPGLPGVPGSNLANSLNAAVDSITGPGVAPPPSAHVNAAAAVAAAVAATTYALPHTVPTSITVWTGGMYVPVANDSIIVMPCESFYRGATFVVAGDNVTTDDTQVMCLNRPSVSGWGWYEVPFGSVAPLYEEVFSGNGTGLVAGDFLELNAYPNGTLYEIRDRDIVMPGNCSNCNIHVDASGKIIAFSSGDSVVTGNHTVWDTAIIRVTDSALIMDENSTIVHAGPAVLNEVTINQLNVTELIVGGPTVLNETTITTLQLIEPMDELTVNQVNVTELNVEGHTVLNEATIDQLNVTTLYVNGQPIPAPATGVTSITGTIGQISVSASTGNVTLSLASTVTQSTLVIETLLNVNTGELRLPAGATYVQNAQVLPQRVGCFEPPLVSDSGTVVTTSPTTAFCGVIHAFWTDAQPANENLQIRIPNAAVTEECICSAWRIDASWFGVSWPALYVERVYATTGGEIHIILRIAGAVSSISARVAWKCELWTAT